MWNRVSGEEEQCLKADYKISTDSSNVDSYLAEDDHRAEDNSRQEAFGQVAAASAKLFARRLDNPPPVYNNV